MHSRRTPSTEGAFEDGIKITCHFTEKLARSLTENTYKDKKEFWRVLCNYMRKRLRENLESPAPGSRLTVMEEDDE